MARRPETKLMNAIFGPSQWFEDGDLELDNRLTLKDLELDNKLTEKDLELDNKLTLLDALVYVITSLGSEKVLRVLSLRFGFADGRSRTLEEVGQEFNLTRERIRQIESKALRRLRHPSRSRGLRQYIKVEARNKIK